MATIEDVYARLELDARKFANRYVYNDRSIKNIVESAFLLGEMYIAKKVINYVEKESKDGND